MKIEGIPDGWELVRIGTPVVNVDWVVDSEGKPRLCDIESTFLNRVIIRKIEKPRKYRPFQNAAEFEPFRDRWVKHPNEPDKRFAPADYNNEGVWGVGGRMYDYETLFKSGTLFDDGTPFGVEVTE